MIKFTSIWSYFTGVLVIILFTKVQGRFTSQYLQLNVNVTWLKPKTNLQNISCPNIKYELKQILGGEWSINLYTF